MSIEELCECLVQAKNAESLANAQRVDIEQQIIELIGKKEEGTRTVKAKGWTVKVDQTIRRKIDEKAWGLVKDQIPEALSPVSIKEELKVKTKGLRWLKDNEPGYYKLLCTAITETPAKPSVKVEKT